MISIKTTFCVVFIILRLVWGIPNIWGIPKITKIGWHFAQLFKFRK